MTEHVPRSRTDQYAPNHNYNKHPPSSTGDPRMAGSNSHDRIEVICGPLINFKGLDVGRDSSVWNGTVLIVTKPGQRQPQLQLTQAGPVGPDASRSQQVNGTQSRVYDAVKLYEDPGKTFWRFSISAPVETYEARWEYYIPDFHYVSADVAVSPWYFVVPALDQSMRIMFHSCNGFSVGTDMNVWIGPNLWNDVLRIHREKPFHVMLGGGDQIYNDSIRVDGPLKTWTNISNPHKRRTHDFDESLRAACDDYYYENYASWYATEPFKTANGQIPQINIWDDHDIIDGFGSYTDHFMRCAVFRGIGGVAFKYYCLFQHHLAPPKSTFTTDAPATMYAVNGTAGADPRQLQGTYVLEEREQERSWIIGKRPGPYVEERSRSLYMRLGRRVAFLGVDARTERTRHQVNYPETYDAIFDRLNREVAAAGGEIKHLILLLGIPVAYPRLAWLENFLRSPIIGPIRLLNKRFGLAGGFFNNFDGKVDLLDDLDDHYTARAHKQERRLLMLRLQEFSNVHSVRVTMLGGDVHLAAVGRFYSVPKLGLHVENDHRYMVNVISSAITNKPPPKGVANLLARRNKIHHLDGDTDETLMALFDQNPGGPEKSAEWNHVTMPSRNFAVITEVRRPSSPSRFASDSGFGANGTTANGTNGRHTAPDGSERRTNEGQHDDHDDFSHVKDGHQPLHKGEVNAGTTHFAADGIHNDSDGGGGGMHGSLDVAIRVEIDPSDRKGTTRGYGFNIPPLMAVSRTSTTRPPSAPY